MYLNNFVPHIDLTLPKGPLALGMSKKSGLVQLLQDPPLDALYRQYWYRSGTNQTMKNQLANLVGSAQEWMPLNDGDVVLDIGCNDGTMLTMLPEHCIKVGIDPSYNLSAEGAEACDFHGTDYFTAELYKAIVPAQKKASLITSVAMFYDLPDPRQLCRDIHEVLDQDGLWIVQMSYAPMMLRQNAFDNICHEHIEYYSFRVFKDLVEEEGFRVVDVELNNTNGGSFRVYLQKSGARALRTLFDRELAECRIISLLLWEEEMCMNTPEPYLKFARRVQKLRTETVGFLRTLKNKGKKVLGYGASTKGNTLLQYYGIDQSLVPAIAEKQPGKFGLRTVGSWIPIISETEMRAANPDYLLVLPWHFREGFIEREADFRKKGGKLIFALPELEVI